MRNVKLLWGMVGCLIVLVAVMGVLLLHAEKKTGASSLSAQNRGGGDHPDHVVARIGGRDIPESVVEQQLIGRHGAELVSQMLDRESLRMEADQSGVQISREEIDQELKHMQQGYDSEELFYESMKKQLGMTKDEIREDVYYKLLLERLATRNVQVSDQDVDTYIKEHPEEFAGSTMLRIEQIVNKTEDQAKRTLELAKSGKDFRQLAKDRSIDTATANDGGDLGWVEADDPFVASTVMKAAEGLQIGQFAGPLQTEEGFVVIHLRDKKEESVNSPEQVHSMVRNMLSLQKAPPLQEVTDSLRKKFGAEVLDPAYK